MKIYFVRHGETDSNKNGTFTGQIDSPLNEEGLEQTKQIVKEIDSDFQEIYTSDLIRCVKTAQILNEKLNIPIVLDKRLRERDFGSLGGKKINEVDPEIRELDKLQQYDYKPYGGEDFNDVKNRLFDFIEELKLNKKDKKVLVVTSGGIIRLLHNMVNNKVYERIHNSSVHEFEL